MQDDKGGGEEPVSRWIDNVTAGRTILGYLECIEVGRADRCVRHVVDASTGRLTEFDVETRFRVRFVRGDAAKALALIDRLDAK